MPIKTTVGLCKKSGLPDYGSVGASCHVEFELDQTLVPQDLEAFYQQVRDAFAACSRAVHDELARQQAPPTEQVHNHLPPPAAMPTASPPQANGNGNNRIHHGGNGHTASQKQLAYLTQLARHIPELGAARLDDLAVRRHGKSTQSLTSLEASSLIDTLKAVKSGEVALARLFPETTPC